MDNSNNNPIQIITSILIVIVVGNFFWNKYGPVMGNYRLKPGHFACSTEDEVVRLRGGQSMGVLATAIVLSKADCVKGPQKVKVNRLARNGRLVSKVEIDGHTRYVDHDGLEKI